MGVIEFFFLVLIVVGFGWLVIYALGVFAPNHPKMVDNIVWFVVVVVIIVALAQAMGLTGYDPRIPRVR